MNLAISLSQNFSLQLSTSLALDKGVEQVHDLAIAHEDYLDGKPFKKEIQFLLLGAHKKGHFRSKQSSDHYLRAKKSNLQRALQMAIRRHYGEYRESGYPYLAHVLSTAYVLARLGFPAEVVLAGILHDTVEDTPDKNRILNELHTLLPSVAWYVYGISGPDIKDSIEKDKILLSRITSFSQQGNSLYPKAIKCADAIANLYDLRSMQGKDGRTAGQRQELFLKKIETNILPFAREIDNQQLIPIKRRKEVFRLEEYIQEKVVGMRE